VPSSRSGQLAVAGMKLELNGDVLTLVGSDLDLTISKSINVGGELDGRIVVPPKLTDVVRSLPGGKIDLTVVDGDLNVTSGRSEFRLKLLPTERWQQPPDPRGAPVDIAVAALRTGLHQVLRAANREEGRQPVLTGVLFQPKEGGLRLIATDSFRLAMADLNGAEFTDLDHEVVIPARALGELNRLLGSAESVRFGVSDIDATFEVDGTSISTRLIDGAYPNVAKLIADEYPNRMVADLEQIREAVKRVRVVSEDGDQTSLILSIEPGRLRLTVETREVGDASEEIDVKFDGESKRIKFRARLFAEGLDMVSGNDVSFEFVEATTAAVLRPVEGDDFTYLLMPMKV
jgi:DNA polymerase-3 subunit beta